ncbi:MAG TPA: response regulator [Thermoleophilia bacterium]|nr:response regulator [Thermoleophilia bacterium]
MARIVVADDDPDILNIVAMSLEAMGHEVHRATNGREAVALTKATAPDLVVMDLMMPEMNGYEATEALKADAETASVPVLALTAKAMRGDEERGRQAGVDAYVTKPFRISQVVEVVDRLL